MYQKLIENYAKKERRYLFVNVVSRFMYKNNNQDN